MSDDEFLHGFMDGSLLPGHFHHRDHLRLAWLLVRRLDVESAGAAVAAGIRRFAAGHGQAAKYHETLTQFWVRIVGHMLHERPDIADFDAFIAAFPQLLDKGLPQRHWQRETLGSAAARATWVEPDLLALPQ
jgi:hypothetical protein